MMTIANDTNTNTTVGGTGSNTYATANNMKNDLATTTISTGSTTRTASTLPAWAKPVPRSTLAAARLVAAAAAAAAATNNAAMNATSTTAATSSAAAAASAITSVALGEKDSFSNTRPSSPTIWARPLPVTLTTAWSRAVTVTPNWATLKTVTAPKLKTATITTNSDRSTTLPATISSWAIGTTIVSTTALTINTDTNTTTAATGIGSVDVGATTANWSKSTTNLANWAKCTVTTSITIPSAWSIATTCTATSNNWVRPMTSTSTGTQMTWSRGTSANWTKSTITAAAIITGTTTPLTTANNILNSPITASKLQNSERQWSKMSTKTNISSPAIGTSLTNTSCTTTNTPGRLPSKSIQQLPLSSTTMTTTKYGANKYLTKTAISSLSAIITTTTTAATSTSISSNSNITGKSIINVLPKK